MIVNEFFFGVRFYLLALEMKMTYVLTRKSLWRNLRNVLFSAIFDKYRSY